MSTEHDRLCELMDREAIRDCIYRYCRGIDRADEDALRSAYWPDAHDSHGAYVGDAEGFVRRAMAAFKRGPRNVHQVTNILIEFAGPGIAVVESYFNALQRGPDPNGIVRQFHLAGRYCDRMERRDGQWRIAERTVIYDWVDAQSPAEAAESVRFGVRKPVGAPFPHDVIYALRERAGIERG
ncbi:MAG: nuclear transport factor 2 family protein [Burkholderiaceae bacterium]